MPDQFRFILPAPPPPASYFARHQLTHKFYREVQARQEHEDYCEWYRQTAKKHQQELKKMQGDINLLGWFCRHKH